MDKSIQKLLSGFKNFQKSYFSSDNELFSELSKSQNPKVLVVACSDSRVDPALITDSLPGDLFVIRNVANLVPPFDQGSSAHHGVSAALEYAVKGLNVEHIVILGHSDCGGIKALMDNSTDGCSYDFIDHWLELALPAKEAVERELSEHSDSLRCQACEEAAILLSLENLLTFPWIAELVEKNKLALHGWYFNLKQGELYGFDAEINRFISLTNPTNT